MAKQIWIQPGLFPVPDESRCTWADLMGRCEQPGASMRCKHGHVRRARNCERHLPASYSAACRPCAEAGSAHRCALALLPQ